MIPGDESRELLLGIVVVQLGFVTSERIVDAVARWQSSKQDGDSDSSLAQTLVDMRLASRGEIQAVQRIVDDQLCRNDGDASACMRSMPSSSALRSVYSGIHQGEIDNPSLPQLPDGLQSAPAWAPVMSSQRYVAASEFKEGGLGKVIRAKDTQLDREVAVKRMRDELLSDAECRSRFQLEAEVTGVLEHPNIVPVYGIGRDDSGRPFYAMRLIHGKTLSETIAQRNNRDSQSPSSNDLVDLRRLLGQFIDVCNAVEYAHSRGVIHRDIKPGNVILGPFGETILLDWGMVKVLGKSTRPTNMGEAESYAAPLPGPASEYTEFGTKLGTPGYMSPEQLAGRTDQIDERSDVYSLGGTLFTLLTGHPSVDRETPNWESLVMLGGLKPARASNPGISPTLSSICEKAMQVEKKDRYQSARELADDVERWLADEPTVAHAETARERLIRSYRRYRVQFLAAGSLLLLATIGATLFSVTVSRQNRRLKSEKALTEKAMNKAGDLTYDFVRVGYSQLTKIPGQNRKLLNILNGAIDSYQEFIELDPNDALSRSRLADALRRKGNLASKARFVDQATSAFDNCISQHEILLESDTSDDVRHEFARALIDKSIFEMKSNRLSRAVETAEDAEKQIDEIDIDTNDELCSRARLDCQVGRLFVQQNKSQEAADRFAAALPSFRSFIESSGEMKDQEYLGEYLTTALLDYYDILKTLGEKAASLEVLSEAVATTDEIATKEPTRQNLNYRALAKLANGASNLSTAAPDARLDIDEAQEIWVKLAEQFPNYLPYQRRQAECELQRAKYFHTVEQFDDSLREIERGINRVDPVVRKHNAISWKETLVDLYQTKATVLGRKGQGQPSVDALSIAIQLQEELSSTNPDSAFQQERLDQLRAMKEPIQ